MTAPAPPPGGVDADVIRERLAVVNDRIAVAARSSGRDPASVTLVAVSKGQPLAALAAALAAGQTVFGENYAQELVAKAKDHAGQAGRHQPVWHFIGRLQRNKVGALAPHVRCWHTLDRESLVDAIARHAPSAEVLIQVDTAGDPARGGCEPGAVPALVERAAAAGLVPVGLMTVPPVAGDPRRHFAQVRRLASELGLAHLSMGMSADFDVAVAEGATIVRIGSAIFGARSSLPRLGR